MRLRRIVTDTHSVDFHTLEDKEAVTIIDLETEQKLTIEAESFKDLVAVVYSLSPQRY